MKVNDILVEGYYDVEKDRYSVALIDDTRRPRFTLEHLNKLRKVREFRKFEKLDQKVFIKANLWERRRLWHPKMICVWFVKRG